MLGMKPREAEQVEVKESFLEMQYFLPESSIHSDLKQQPLGYRN
jgi:hypothetical protein